MPEQFASVDQYIASLPADVAVVIAEVRRRVHAVVPDAGEVIRYQMPTITVDGTSLLHFAGWKHHISLYPEPEGDEALELDLAPYVSGKGTVRLPLTEPFPYELVERVAARHLERRRATPS